MEPLVSVVTISNRPQFREWLLWNRWRQTYKNIQFIFVDTAEQACYDYVHELGASPYVFEGKKNILDGRIRAQADIEGEWFTFWDDDDWQHPETIEALVDAAKKKPNSKAIGHRYAWFMNLRTRKGGPWMMAMPWLVSSIYHCSILKKTPFAQEFAPAGNRGVDNLWARKVDSLRNETQPHLIQTIHPSAIWLHHTSNDSPGGRYEVTSTTQEELRKLAGPKAWGDTDEQLDELSKTLFGSPDR